jgi:kynurenine formamidase
LARGSLRAAAMANNEGNAMRPVNFDHLAEQLRNWGRWGEADQRGTLNHIGAETLKNAAAEVRAGKLFNLGLRFDRDGPQLGRGRFNPMVYATDLFTPLNPAVPNVCYSDDVKLYNGCNARECLTEKGALKMGINHLASPGILSRGVLLDIARLKGVERLPTDYAITVDDLNAAVEKQGVTMAAGDILLVRTGHMQRFTQDGDRAGFMGMQPGLSYTCAEWCHDKSLAAVAADNMAVEILHLEGLQSDMPLAFHMLALRDMGMPLGEMFNLEALAADCASDGRYSVMLSAPPLEVTGGFGSPVNPLALK